MVNLKINDHFFDLIPRLSKHEMQILTESIMRNGLRDPIVISKNHFILDGHSRFEVCQNLGIKPTYRIMRFDSYEEEEEYVVESNMERRQVNNFQKLEIYHNYYELLKKKTSSERTRDERGRVTGQKVNGTRSINILAEKLKMSVNQVQCGIWLINNASPQIKERLRSGRNTINHTFDILKRSEYNISYNHKSLTFNRLYEHFEYDDTVINYLDELKERFRKEKYEAQKNILETSG
jgi:hypothetical protein|tara:strand:+ start:536 stop:1243 length:708 start_codon:yes stop_codon:yes gene_type:complete